MRRAWMPLTTTAATAAGLGAVVLTGWTIQRNRERLEAARRGYEARVETLLRMLTRYPHVTIIRDAKDATLADRTDLEGPLVFLGAEQVMVTSCMFTTAAPEGVTLGDPVQVQ